jgi:peptide/nickel transport system permease protein
MLVFGLQQLLPGDPAIILAGEDRDPAAVAYLREKLRLDKPLPVRYLYWIGGVLRGDLGESLRVQKPVVELVLEKLPVTLQLASMAIVDRARHRHSRRGIVSAVGEGQRVGLRRQRGRAVGLVHAELLARASC